MPIHSSCFWKRSDIRWYTRISFQSKIWCFHNPPHNPWKWMFLYKWRTLRRDRRWDVCSFKMSNGRSDCTIMASFSSCKFVIFKSCWRSLSRPRQTWLLFWYSTGTYLNTMLGLTLNYFSTPCIDIFNSIHLLNLQTTGTTIAASAKIQINMAVKQMSNFESLKNVRRIYYMIGKSLFSTLQLPKICIRVKIFI